MSLLCVQRLTRAKVLKTSVIVNVDYQLYKIEILLQHGSLGLSRLVLISGHDCEGLI